MKTNFEYNKEKDTWCILNKGKSSNNSQSPTKVYEQLEAEYGENATQEEVGDFIDKYLADNNLSVEEIIIKYHNDWESVAAEYHNRAEKIFGVSLPYDITAYLTINNRCPYSIENNCFFVNFPKSSARMTVMHELWHFYTWYGLGSEQEEKLGKEKYNDFKEALTVILNLECADLFPEGMKDYGYPQHQDLREKIINLWNEGKDINKLWNKII